MNATVEVCLTSTILDAAIDEGPATDAADALVPRHPSGLLYGGCEARALDGDRGGRVDGPSGGGRSKCSCCTAAQGLSPVQSRRQGGSAGQRRCTCINATNACHSGGDSTRGSLRRHRLRLQADSVQQAGIGQWPNERIDGRAVFLHFSHHCFHNDEALQAISAYIGRRHWSTALLRGTEELSCARRVRAKRP